MPPGGVQKAAEPDPSASSTQLRAPGAARRIADHDPAAALLPGHEIDERYQALRDLVGHGPAAPIDLVLREVGDVQQQIAKLAATLVEHRRGAITSGGIDPLLALKADAARQPQPLGRWLTEIAASAIALRSGDPRLQLATIFNAPAAARPNCARRW